MPRRANPKQCKTGAALRCARDWRERESSGPRSREGKGAEQASGDLARDAVTGHFGGEAQIQRNRISDRYFSGDLVAVYGATELDRSSSRTCRARQRVAGALEAHRPGELAHRRLRFEIPVSV